MFQQPDKLSSQRVEETIDQLSVNDPSLMSTSEQARLNPDARLVHDMQKLYAFERKRYQRALQRVEDRLVEQYVTKDERLAPQPAQPGQQARASRPIQQGRMYSMEQKKSRMSSFGRRISVLVAVLVMAVLVGSLVFVISAAHQQTAQRPNNTTRTGAAQTSTDAFGKTVYTKSDTSTSFASTGFNELAWSPDSTRVASLADGVQIWDATTGKHQITVSMPTNVFASYALAWSPNSQLVAVGTNAGILIVNGQTGAIVHTYPVSTIANTLPSAGSGTLLSAHMPASGGMGVRGLAWSHDGSSLAVAISDGPTGRIQVLNPQTGAVDYTLPVTGNYVPVVISWSADGKYMAAGVFNTEAGAGPGQPPVPADQQNEIRVWNTATKQVVFQHTGGSNSNSVAWSPKSDTLAFGALQGNTFPEQMLLTLWNASTSQLTTYQDRASGPLAWSPDGKYIAFAGTPLSDSVEPSTSLVSVIDASTSKLVYEYKQMDGQVATIAWSPNGKYIVSGEGNTQGTCVARVWTAE